MSRSKHSSRIYTLLGWAISAFLSNPISIKSNFSQIQSIPGWFGSGLGSYWRRLKCSHCKVSPGGFFCKVSPGGLFFAKCHQVDFFAKCHQVDFSWYFHIESTAKFNSRNCRAPSGWIQKILESSTNNFLGIKTKGRHRNKKNVFFRALPESPKHPPHDPNSGNLVLFFLRQKRRFARRTGKKIDADDDNYDKND